MGCCFSICKLEDLQNIKKDEIRVDEIRVDEIHNKPIDTDSAKVNESAEDFITINVVIDSITKSKVSTPVSTISNVTDTEFEIVENGILNQ
jgi:hypothetical protein